MKRGIALLSVLLTFSGLFAFPVNCAAADVPEVSRTRLSEREAQTALPGSYGYYLTHPLPESDSDADTDTETAVLDVGSAKREGDALEWAVSFPRGGRYYIRLRYTPRGGVGGGSQNVIRLLLNGTVPYRELENAQLPTEYRDELPIRQDLFGNDIRPEQKLAGRETENLLFDSAQTYTEPLSIRFAAGESTLRLECISGDADIAALILEPVSALRPYAEIKEEYALKKYAEATGRLKLIQGQEAAYKSATTIYPGSDRSSSITSPQEEGAVKLNSIGGAQWSKAGDYIAWTFNAPQSGLYRISLRVRQNTSVGAVSTRSIYINGALPFAEARAITIPFNTKWQVITLGNGSEDYLFYLNEGDNEIRLVSTLGDMDTVIRMSDSAARSLNEIYRKFLIIMGASPDLLRDYRLATLCPDQIEELKEQADTLDLCADWLDGYVGGGNSGVALMRTMIRQLNRMYDDPDIIPQEFSYFKTNIGSLSTWSGNAKRQPLALDVLGVGNNLADMPKANAGFFAEMRFGILKFLYSFSSDYQNMGQLDTESMKGEPLTVWIGGGREQAQIVRNMLITSFTPEKKIPVRLQLTQAPLITAAVAGVGPDVVINNSPDVFNFAMRNAACSLSDFEDAESIFERFHPSLFIPLSYMGKVYALPETISFPVMFYRTDIFEELELEVPQTWDDIIALSSSLMRNNMEFGLPSTSGEFVTILKQRGLEVYANEGEYCLLDRPEAIETFRIFTNFFSNYGFSLSYSFLNRFRSGEMPIGIAPISFYNEIPIAAPEINELWGIAQIPGTKKPDGSIDRTALSGGSGCMILQSSDKQDKGWEFLKWWTSAEIQREFAAEIEGLMGPASRYSSANNEALADSSWPTECKDIFNRQMQSLTAIENVPGGYFLTRNLNNAFRAVVYKSVLPTDAMYDYTYKINRELTAKRQEFGLSVWEGS